MMSLLSNIPLKVQCENGKFALKMDFQIEKEQAIRYAAISLTALGVIALLTAAIILMHTPMQAALQNASGGMVLKECAIMSALGASAGIGSVVIASLAFKRCKAKLSELASPITQFIERRDLKSAVAQLKGGALALVGVAAVIGIALIIYALFVGVVTTYSPAIAIEWGVLGLGAASGMAFAWLLAGPIKQLLSGKKNSCPENLSE